MPNDDSLSDFHTQPLVGRECAVLLSTDTRRRERLLAVLQHCLPELSVRTARDFFDLVYLVAANQRALVLVDLHSPDTLSAAHPMALRGIAPAAFLLAVSDTPEPLRHIWDAVVAIDQLAQWLGSNLLRPGS